jgi:hypothetical protein
MTILEDRSQSESGTFRVPLSVGYGGAPDIYAPSYGDFLYC